MIIKVAETKLVKSLKSVGAMLNLMLTVQTTTDPIAKLSGQRIA